MMDKKVLFKLANEESEKWKVLTEQVLKMVFVYEMMEYPECLVIIEILQKISCNEVHSLSVAYTLF